MHRKLLPIIILLCVLLGLPACQAFQPVDNQQIHTQTPTATEGSTAPPEETVPAPTETPTGTLPETATPTTPQTATPTSTPTATKTPTKAPVKTPTGTTNTTPKPTSPGKKYNLPYVLYVNRTQNVVTVYCADEKGNAVTPLKVMLCSTGRNNGTGRGTFYITDKYTWRALFGGVYGQYACRFNGNVLFHSVPYASKKKDSLKAEEFNKLGTQASDGCVRLSVEDCKWIYDNCASGTKVVVYASNDPEPLPKPNGIKIPLTSTWDPTDPDVNNPWHSQIPVLPVTFSGVPVGEVEVQRNAALPDFMKGIKAVDSIGVDVTDKIQVSHVLDVGKTGAYIATYQITNGTTGGTAVLHVTYRVVDKTAPIIDGLNNRWEISVQTIESTTKEQLLRNVTITDDGDVLSTEEVIVTINGEEYKPELLQIGQENSILFTVKDSSGNTAQKEVIVFVSGTTATPAPTEQPTD